MSLRDLGKNDISEETQALKDRLASRDTENAGLRTRLMKREAELEELQATLNETVYKLSKEAERALQLEDEVSSRSSELKTERMSLRNTELALQSAQEKLKAEERTKKELESTLDTVSLHSQTTSAENQSVQREKRALESRVRELERIVQTHEAKGTSNLSRKNGRPRSSSVSNFRLPAVEQELNDAKTQLHTKDMNLRMMENKLAQAQDNLVKEENARIANNKVSQKRITELLSVLEKKEEELDSLRETENAGQREEELLKRIDEDAAKITALEKLVAEGQTSRTSQARIQKLQSQLKAECDKAHRSEDFQNRLLHEKEELVRQYEASQREVEGGHKLLMVRECQLNELEAKHTHLLAELDIYRCREEAHPLGTERHSSQPQEPSGIASFPDETALADHIQTLLQAIDRLRGERDELKRALEFSEVEYRITTEGFQARIASLTNQLTGTADCIANEFQPNIRMELRMKQLTSCAVAFAVVISNVQTRLDLSENHLSVMSTDLASSDSQLHDALVVIENQKQQLDSHTQEHDALLHKFDAMVKELSTSDEDRHRLRLQLADAESQIATVVENAKAFEVAKEEVEQSLLSTEQRFTALSKDYQDIESERNTLALQITNLQNDLVRVQDELGDTQNRYNTLHAQQLSAMSTSEAVQALKDRIQELEARIMERNDQISDYQHDIRRLEANAKLHEERLAEMTSELELLASQKDAMVEDCAEARQARDEAVQRSEVAADETERLQQQLQEVKYAYDVELAAMSSMMANLTSENQQTTARLAELDGEHAGTLCEIDTLNRDHQRLIEELNATASRSQSLELMSSKENGEMQQAIISLAVVYDVYKDFVRRLRRSHQHTASLESQLVTLSRELEKRDAFIVYAEKDEQAPFRRLSGVSTVTDVSQDNLMSSSGLQTTVAELPRTHIGLWRQEAVHSHDMESLRSSLREKEEELALARQLLEETKSHSAEVEADLQERITLMTTAQAEQAEEITSLRMELENVRTRLQDSLENFSHLEKLHVDVIQEFTTSKDVFDHRLSETDSKIRSLDVDHQRSLATVEAKHRHEIDILTNNLEDREHEVDELRRQLQDISEAHMRTTGKLHEELRSHEARHTLVNDLEKDLRRTLTDMGRRLAQAEAETLALQEERRVLQAEITGLQAEIQRSASLTRYLESQIRESEDACTSLKESLRTAELSLAESEKAGKAAEFNLTLQTTQHEKVVATFRREIASLQSAPELRSALADLEGKNREMDDLLRAKCQEIEDYDDRILETLKANKKLTGKVESLTRKIQALQAKFASKKNQPQEETGAKATPPKTASPILSPPVIVPIVTLARNHSTSSHIGENTGPSFTFRAKTPEPRLESVMGVLSSRTPDRTHASPGSEVSVGKKRPAPDDDERDGIPAEGRYSTDAHVRNGPTPRLRRTHGHPAGFTPVRGASLRKPAGLASPIRRGNVGVAASEVITDVTNSPRGPSGQGDAQLKKRGWLGKVRSGASSQPASSRPGALGRQ